jgi:hypothetical protein
MDAGSGVALDLKTGVPCYQVEDEEGRIHLLIHLPIEEKDGRTERSFLRVCFSPVTISPFSKPSACRKLARNYLDYPMITIRPHNSHDYAVLPDIDNPQVQSLTKADSDCLDKLGNFLVVAHANDLSDRGHHRRSPDLPSSPRRPTPRFGEEIPKQNMGEKVL